VDSVTNLKRFPVFIPLRTVGCATLKALAMVLAFSAPVRGQSSDATARKIGDTWEYRIYNVADARINRTRTITVTDIRGDTIKLRRVDSVDPPSESEEKIEDFYPDQLVPGLEWRRTRTIDGKEFWSSFKAQNWVAIKTASGNFRAMRVDSVFTHPKGTFRQTIWYAPGARAFVMLHHLDDRGEPFEVTELIRLQLK